MTSGITIDGMISSRVLAISKVVHAGGISGPMLLRDQPARICEINLHGLTDLLEAARVHGLARVVWFSSITAYGNRPDLAPVDEETPLHPSTIYAATKAAGEALLGGLLLRAWGRQRRASGRVMLRPWPHHGMSDPDASSRTEWRGEPPGLNRCPEKAGSTYSSRMWRTPLFPGSTRKPCRAAF